MERLITAARAGDIGLSASYLNFTELIDRHLLNQMTADATGCVVHAGPVEATAIGNILVQAMASGQVAIRHGLRGPNSSVVTACATSTNAIGDAFKIIQRGDADGMITGGTEAVITPMGVGGFCAMRALSCRNDEPRIASRPFDKGRDGFVMGEGAGLILLEEMNHALKRGAKIYA